MSEANPESPEKIRIPLETRRMLGRFRALIVEHRAKVDLTQSKVDAIDKVYSLIDKKVTTALKAIETKEDIELFERMLNQLRVGLQPQLARINTMINQAETVLDAIEALV